MKFIPSYWIQFFLMITICMLKVVKIMLKIDKFQDTYFRLNEETKSVRFDYFSCLFPFLSNNCWSRWTALNCLPLRVLWKDI